MSFGARLVLGVVAALFGAAMLAIAPSMEKPIAIAGFGAFCFTIAGACLLRGRIAQMCGSLIASGVLLAGAFYFVHELILQHWWSASRGEPSLSNATRFLGVYGLPALAYLVYARFGFAAAKRHTGPGTARAPHAAPADTDSIRNDDRTSS